MVLVKGQTMVTVDFRLADDVAQKARSLGILNDESLGALVEAEIRRKRQEAGQRLLETMDALNAQFKADYGHLSDQEQQDLLNQWIAEANEAKPEA
jgi:hypothetical protein